jgi:hypothetical protein
LESKRCAPVYRWTGRTLAPIFILAGERPPVMDDLFFQGPVNRRQRVAGRSSLALFFLVHLATGREYCTKALALFFACLTW